LETCYRGAAPRAPYPVPGGRSDRSWRSSGQNGRHIWPCAREGRVRSRGSRWRGLISPGAPCPAGVGFRPRLAPADGAAARRRPARFRSGQFWSTRRAGRPTCREVWTSSVRRGGAGGLGQPPGDRGWQTLPGHGRERRRCRGAGCGHPGPVARAPGCVSHRADPPPPGERADRSPDEVPP
jgi:hypothetical protein